VIFQRSLASICANRADVVGVQTAILALNQEGPESMAASETRDPATGEPSARPSGAALTVWFDGGCPLCTREIALFRRLDRRKAIHFEDVSGSNPSCPIDRAELLARFHAQETGKPIVSGAAAFAAMWRAIPALRPFGEIARVPVILWTLEKLYLLFLGLRPRLQQMMRKTRRQLNG
jgi:predicted DCC family thiol-disulfide oxidoreductase YuxK